MRASDWIGIVVFGLGSMSTGLDVTAEASSALLSASLTALAFAMALL